MIKAFQYRLYPTKKQSSSLALQLGAHRCLYNQALEERKETYKKTGPASGITYSAQATKLLPRVRKESETVALCNYSSLQQTLRRLDKTFKAFFRRVQAGEEEPGYPRFKPATRFNTISYATLGDGCQIKENRLYLQNVGCIKVKWHRPLKGKIKTVSVTRRNRKWYVSFAVECGPEPLPETGKEVGSLKAFVATSDGQHIEAPKYLRKSEKQLAKAQKRLSRRQKDSNRRRKAARFVAKKHEHIANQRLDFCHKVASSLVKAYDGFAVETLNIKGMVKNRHLSKSISDASWRMFLLVLKGKAESAGRWYREVPSNGTSQRCSNCGEVVKKSLAVRTHKCPRCGLLLDRDLNAALNILKQARTGPSARSRLVGMSPRSCRL